MGTRREKVILELEDRFTTDMARAAAATALLDKNLDSLSDSAVGTNRDLMVTKSSVGGLGDEVDDTSDKVRKGSADIDRYSGRLRLLTEAAVTLGPALIPIGAVAVPAVVALAAGLGAAAGAAGVALLAFHGVGDALKALDAYQLDPSTAHLKKMNEEFEKLGPTGVAFVMFLDDIEPKLKDLQDITRQGMFPGVEAGITSLLTMLPQLRLIMFSLATEFGRLTAEAGAALSGDGFAAFFDYLETDAAPTLAAFAHTLGNIGQGLGSLMVAFAPLSRDFSSGMEAMSASFARWAAGLSETDGFRSFVAYLRESGPQVLSLLGSLATAFIAIAQAAAPVGAAVLPALTALAKVLALIANSPIGPPLFTAAVAMMALSRATTIANAAMVKFSASSAAGAKNLALLGAGLNFAVILSGIWAVDAALDKVFGDRSVDTENLTRNLMALSDGRAVDNLDQIGKNLDIVNRAGAELSDQAFGWLPGDTTWGEAKDNIDQIDQALAQMVESGNGEQAADAFAQIMAQAKAAGVSTAEATKWFGQYALAQKNAASAADEATAAQLAEVDAATLAAGATQRKTAADNMQARVARQAKQEITGLTAAMEEQTSAALGAFDAVTQYNRALDEAQKQARKSEAGINAATEAGRKNRDALSQLAGAWNNQSNAVRNNVDKFREARKAFIDTAQAMGVPIDKAKQLANSLMEIPRSVVSKIEARTDPALQAIARIKRELASVPRSIRTDYYVNQVNAINKRGQYADGGYTGPGGRNEPAGIVHRGEVVIPQDLVRRDWPMLSSRYGHLPGFADGGLAGSSHGPGRPNLTPAQLAAEVLNNLASAGKNELAIRKRLLEHEVDRDQKAYDAAKKHRAAVLDDMRSLRESVANRFKSDLFVQQQQSGFTIEMPQSFDSAEQAQAWFAAQQQVRDAQNSNTQSPVDILRSDIARRREARQLYRQLRSAGLSGSALSYAQQNADNDQLRGLLDDPKLLRQFQRLYGQREQGANQLGQLAANQRYARALDRSNAHLSDVKDELKASKQIQHQMEKRLAAIEKNTKDAPEKTGKSTAEHLDGTAGRAAGRR